MATRAGLHRAGAAILTPLLAEPGDPRPTDRLRLRRSGAVSRSAPQALAHRPGAGAVGTRLLCLPPLPTGPEPPRSRIGRGRHGVFARRTPHDGAGGGGNQLRQGPGATRLAGRYRGRSQGGGAPCGSHRRRYPEARPRIISDNGPQFIAKDFKEFIRISGTTHVRTSPFYPQSNGKIERWHKSLKSECIRPGTPLSLDDARRLVEGYVEHYNNVRLNSAIGYITPKDMLAGRQKEIHAERDRKPESARQQRQIRRRQPVAALATAAADR